MNPADLPEDPAEWPADPHELFGVPPGCDERTLRRAYANLIRRFKPEQYPEQFRLIRSAYEMLLNFRQHFGMIQIELPAEPQPPKDDPPAEEKAPTEDAAPGLAQPADDTPAEKPRPKRPRRRVTDELAEAWQLAEQNDPQAAHAALGELYERRQNNAEIPLRLYWLEKVQPDLAASANRMRWLERAMMQSSLMGTASELFREELQERPSLAIGSGREFVHAAAYPARLAEVTGWRWQAALRAGEDQIVRDEFAAIQDRLQESMESWLRLIFATMEVAVWHGHDSLVATRCRQEIERLMHLNSTMAFEFDRNDMLQGLATEWAQYRDQRRVSPLIKSLVPLSWHGTPQRIGSAIREFVAQIVAEPNHWLGQFDYFAKPYPMSLYQIATAFQQYEMTLDSWPERPDANESLTLAMSFFQRRAKAQYSLTRVKLLEFCIRECVRPEWLTAYLPTEKRPILTRAGRLVNEAVHNDHALRLVCWAHCLFWAK